MAAMDWVTQEKAYVDLMLELDEMELRLKQSRLKQALIPPDWHRIERDVPVRPKKEKLTAAFDADLVKWFCGMGVGYQARMNAVLRAGGSSNRRRRQGARQG